LWIEFDRLLRLTLFEAVPPPGAVVTDAGASDVVIVGNHEDFTTQFRYGIIFRTVPEFDDPPPRQGLPQAPHPDIARSVRPFTQFFSLTEFLLYFCLAHQH